MNSWRRFVGGLGLASFVGLALVFGCTRQLAVMPAIVPTPTPIPAVTPTPTATNSPTTTSANTPTNSPTPSPTDTPTNSPTDTITDTPGSPTMTPSDTPTPTISNTATSSHTVTVTSTPTNTPSVTPTPPNPYIIADFEEGGAADVTGTSANLSGVWYSVADTNGSSISPGSPFTLGGPGNGSPNAAIITGTTGTTADPVNIPIFASLQGDFLAPQASYSISSNVPSATGFIFYIKGNAATTQVWFGVSDSTTSSTNDTAGVTVTVTTSWQPVTVFFNRMRSQGWGSPGHMFDPSTALSFSWKLTTQNTAYDLEVDDFQFTNAPAPPPFTSTPTPDPLLIDTMEDNDNQISVQNGRDGFWYCFLDQYRSGIVNTPIVLSSKPLTVVGGETAASNPITLLKTGTVLNVGTVPAGTTIVWGQSSANTGTSGSSPWTNGVTNTFVMSAPGYLSNNCAELKGAVGPACTASDPVSTGSYQICPFVGMGFDFINTNGGPKQSYDLTSYTGVKFYAKIGVGTAALWRVQFPLPLTTAIADGGSCGTSSNCSDHYQIQKTITTSWVQYTVPLLSGAGNLVQQGFGPPVTWDKTKVFGVTWEADNATPGANADLFVDNLYFY